MYPFIATALFMISSTWFLSCAAVYTLEPPSISRILVEQRSNGYVLKIFAARKIGKVEAWIGNDNWLYITIPDTSIDFSQLDGLENSPLIARTQFFRYTDAAQITLQLKEKVDQVQVLRYPDDDDVYVVLYQFKSNS